MRIGGACRILKLLVAFAFDLQLQVSATIAPKRPIGLDPLLAMILVVSLELVLFDEALHHCRDTLVSFRNVQRQIEEIVECIGWFLTFRADYS